MTFEMGEDFSFRASFVVTSFSCPGDVRWERWAPEMSSWFVRPVLFCAFRGSSAIGRSLSFSVGISRLPEQSPAPAFSVSCPGRGETCSFPFNGRLSVLSLSAALSERTGLLVEFQHLFGARQCLRLERPLGECGVQLRAVVRLTARGLQADAPWVACRSCQISVQLVSGGRRGYHPARHRAGREKHARAARARQRLVRSR